MGAFLEIKEALLALENKRQKEQLSRFFKTGKGEYGEGDIFIGLRVPQMRAIAKSCGRIELDEIRLLIQDPIHECRLTGLFLLIQLFNSTKDEMERKAIIDCYCSLFEYVNNWNLVDLSAPKLLGVYLFDKQDRSCLYTYAHSTHLWTQRIAMVTCWYFNRHGDTSDTFKLADILLYHKHDLIQKAVGWMLREAGKRDFQAEYDFLTGTCPEGNIRYLHMPRTCLRYAIEKFPELMRQDFLKGRL